MSPRIPAPPAQWYSKPHRDKAMIRRGVLALVGVALTLVAILQAIPYGWAGVGAPPGTPRFGKIIRLDPRLDRLVPHDAVLEKVADGFSWVEGPVWNKKGGYLLFSDIPNNSIFKWQESAEVSLFLKPSGYFRLGPIRGQRTRLKRSYVRFDRPARAVRAWRPTHHPA